MQPVTKSFNTSSGLGEGADLYADGRWCPQLSRAGETRTFLSSLQHVTAQEDGAAADDDIQGII